MFLEIIDYKFYLFLLISYLGIFIGIIISHFAKEELKKGKFYFKILKSIVFGLIIFVFFQQIINIYISGLIASLMAFISYLFERKNYNSQDFLYYGFYALALFESMKTEAAIFITILVFFFGLLVSSIIAEQYNEMKFWHSVASISPLYLHYIIIGIILSLIF